MDARKAMKQAQQSSRPHKQAPAQRKKRLIPCFPGMQNILNFARFCIYLAIVSWAAIVLGLACNFEKMLVSSDLTRFVPLAIFIAVTTMLVVIGLLLAPFALRHNPISTLYELVLLAFLGIFWLVLGLYTATAEMGDVECYADEAETEPIEYEAFTTDIYHAQYRALEGFALINVFMLLGFLFFMLLQAFIQHRKGYKTVWSTPLPMYPWFGRRRHHRSNTTHKLPPPATHKDQPKGGKGAPQMSTKPSAGYVTKFTTPPALPPKAAVAGKPAVYRSQSLSAPKPAAAAPRPPVRSKTVTRPSGATATANAKTYPSQYTRPAGQSSNSRPVPPKQSAPAPAKAGQKSTSAAVTRQPSQRR